MRVHLGDAYPMVKMASSAVVRIAGIASLAFAAVTLLLGAGVFWAARGELAYDLDQRILTERVAVLREARIVGLPAVVAARAAHGSQDMRYALIDRHDRPVAGDRMTATPHIGWSDMDFVEDGEPDPTRAVASRRSDGSLLVVGADPEAIEQLSERLVQLFASAFGLIAVIGVVGSLILGRHLASRLGAINRTAEAIIGGDLRRRVPVGRAGDEFDRLAATLNRMLDRIEGLLDNLRRVSGDVAHDLRTPLTQLRQRLEQGLAAGDDAGALQEAVHGALERCDDALALFAAILAISEVEAGRGLRMTRLDLGGVVRDVAEGYRPAVEDQDRAFVVQAAPEILVTGNRQLLAQMLGNLLDNALRHTPEGAAIGVRLEADAVEARLIVSDAGPGIAEEDRIVVLGRFARLERSRSTAGHGLGLSLVAAVARAHGGDVVIGDARPGTRVIVSLPLTPQDERHGH